MEPAVSKDQRLASVLEGHIASALQGAGWTLYLGEGAAQYCVARGDERYWVVFRHARDARRATILPLMADAILRGRASVSGEFLVMVGAPAISGAMARSIEAYMAEIAPNLSCTRNSRPPEIRQHCILNFRCSICDLTHLGVPS